MKSKQEDKMSREEIIKYVNDLIKVKGEAYDRDLSPLLYEFFLRANEKFEWSRKEFLEKYQNFTNNVETLKIEYMEKVGMPSFWSGGMSANQNNKGIYISKKLIEKLKELPTNESIDTYIYICIIDNLFHECLHATDIKKGEYGEIIQNGLYHSGDNNEGDTMLNEFANVLSTSLISSDKSMYIDNYGINFVNNGSYENIRCPGAIMCAALDITEPQLAKLKDKGGDFFYEYLQNKFPYVDIGDTLDVFKSSLNVIFNASMKEDKENISLGLKNMIDAAINLISNRLENALSKGEDRKETLERIYYDIYKCRIIVKNIDSIYGLEKNNKVFNDETRLKGLELENKVKIYYRFLDNEGLYTQEEKEAIQNGENAIEIIESKFADDYIDLEFDIEEIVKKYYPQSNEPLNDNTELIEQIKNTILKQMPLQNIEELQEENTSIMQKSANFRKSMKYENDIIHNVSTSKEEQSDIQKENQITER